MKSSITGATRLFNSRVFELRGCEPARYVVDYVPELDRFGEGWVSSMEIVPADAKPWCTRSRRFDSPGEAILDAGRRALKDVERLREEQGEAVTA